MNMQMKTSNKIQQTNCVLGMRALAPGSVDLILTDPPYEAHDMSEFFVEMVRVLRPAGSLYIFGDKNVVAEHWYRQLVIPHKSLLVWHYKNSPKPKGRWRMSMQAIIYGWKSRKSVFHEDAARIPYLPATQKLQGRMRPSTGRLSDARPYDVSKGALPRDVIEHPALLGHLSRERVGHPDQKPLGLFEKIILASSNIGDFVLDPFAGSGTTIIAAHRLGRNSLGFEIDPRWVKVARTRLRSTKAKT